MIAADACISPKRRCAHPDSPLTPSQNPELSFNPAVGGPSKSALAATSGMLIGVLLRVPAQAIQRAVIIKDYYSRLSLVD